MLKNIYKLEEMTIQRHNNKEWNYNETLILLETISEHWGSLNNTKNNAHRARIWEVMFNNFNKKSPGRTTAFKKRSLFC